jgi:amidase
VADAAAVLDVISAPDPYGWWNAPPADRPFADELGAHPGRLRVALCTVSAMGLPVADEPAAAVARAGKLLESLGHHVWSLDADVLDVAGMGAFLHVMNAGFSEPTGIDWTRVEPHNRAGHRAAAATDSLTLARSIGELRQMTRTIVSRFDDEFDLLVTPTMTIEPPKVGLLEAVHAERGPVLDIVAMAAFTAAFNITGQPVVSLPLHMSPSGLPVGVQIVAGPWREGQLLRVASQLEGADPWAGRSPRSV